MNQVTQRLAERGVDTGKRKTERYEEEVKDDFASYDCLGSATWMLKVGGREGDRGKAERSGKHPAGVVNTMRGYDTNQSTERGHVEMNEQVLVDPVCNAHCQCIVHPSPGVFWTDHPSPLFTLRRLSLFPLCAYAK